MPAKLGMFDGELIPGKRGVRQCGGTGSRYQRVFNRLTWSKSMVHRCRRVRKGTGMQGVLQVVTD